jgi:hypothetical protein
MISLKSFVKLNGSDIIWTFAVTTRTYFKIHMYIKVQKHSYNIANNVEIT